MHKKILLFALCAVFLVISAKLSRAQTIDPNNLPKDPEALKKYLQNLQQNPLGQLQGESKLSGYRFPIYPNATEITVPKTSSKIPPIIFGGNEAHVRHTDSSPAEIKNWYRDWFENEGKNLGFSVIYDSAQETYISQIANLMMSSSSSEKGITCKDAPKTFTSDNLTGGFRKKIGNECVSFMMIAFSSKDPYCANYSLAVFPGTSTDFCQQEDPEPTPSPSPSQSYLLTVVKTGSGSGVVTSNPAGINCGSECSKSFVLDKYKWVALNAKAGDGSIFKGWSYAKCSPGALTCVVTMDGNVTVRAEFAPATPKAPGLPINTVPLGYDSAGARLAIKSGQERGMNVLIVYPGSGNSVIEQLYQILVNNRECGSAGCLMMTNEDSPITVTLPGYPNIVVVSGPLISGSYYNNPAVINAIMDHEKVHVVQTYSAGADFATSVHCSENRCHLFQGLIEGQAESVSQIGGTSYQKFRTTWTKVREWAQRTGNTQLFTSVAMGADDKIPELMAKMEQSGQSVQALLTASGW